MKQKLLVGGLIVLGLGITVFFGLRAFHAFGRIRHRPPPPAMLDVTMIRGWMTIPFVARGYAVPAPDLFQSVAIPPNGNLRKSLDQLNQEYYPNSPNYVIDHIEQTILTYRELHPPPPRPGGSPGPTPQGAP